MKPSTKDRLTAVLLTALIVSAYLFVGTQDYEDAVRAHAPITQTATR